MNFHKPVLLKEVIESLNVEKNKNYVDCTAGEGGHCLEILKKNGPLGKVLALEINPILCEKLREKKEKRLIVVNEDFSKLKEVVKKLKFEEIEGILFDFGLSSWHLEKSGLGFSFLKDEPLIMRYDLTKEKIKIGDYSDLTAAKVINEFSEKEIEKILKKFGQERFAKKIAKKIVEKRKEDLIVSTSQLVNVIKEAVPKWYQKRKIHFATKTFLALRIFVNRELERIEKGLKAALEVLKPGGKIVTITFHSLEDKICKEFFKKMENLKKIKILTKKPILPSKKEIKENKRARSAKLRVVQKIL